MKLDLARFHITELNFQCTQAIDGRVVGELAELATPTQGAHSEEGIHFVEIYSRSGVVYAAAAGIHPTGAPDVERQFGVSFLYSIVQPAAEKAEIATHYQRRSTSIADLIELLSHTNGAHRFDCRASFLYPVADFVPILALPVKLTNWPDFPFDEIVGARFVKRQGASISYSAVVDCADDDLHVELSYEWQHAYSPDLPRRVLLRAVYLSKRFVRS